MSSSEDVESCHSSSSSTLGDGTAKPKLQRHHSETQTLNVTDAVSDNQVSRSLDRGAFRRNITFSHVSEKKSESPRNEEKISPSLGHQASEQETKALPESRKEQDHEAVPGSDYGSCETQALSKDAEGDTVFSRREGNEDVERISSGDMPECSPAVSSRPPSVELAHGSSSSSSSEDEAPTRLSTMRVQVLGSQVMEGDGDRNIVRGPRVEEPVSSGESSAEEELLQKKGSVLFFHLDLGIGGAERLIVCMAQAISKEYKTTVATTRFSHSHCFPECCQGSFEVVAFGRWIPRNLFGMLTAVFSILRLLVLFWFLLFRRLVHSKKYDIIINDQLAMFNPLLYLIGNKVAFYCHFPDPLMANPRARCGNSIYRYGIDTLEKYGVNHCDKLWTNSAFTKDKFHQVFDRDRGKKVSILYPCVPLEYKSVSESDLPDGVEPHRYFLSLNRYEIKKNHLLAMLAFGIFATKHSNDEFKDYKLVVCGGYDHSLLENQLCFLQLVKALDYIKGVDKTNVHLIRSATDRMRLALLKFAAATVYTPSNEHFGIVPIESMSQGTPVIAVNSGGPMESVIDGSTGSLVDSTADAFADAMELWKVKEASTTLECQRRSREFSFRRFSTTVLNSVGEISQEKTTNFWARK
eukprot:Gregarina_sp_Poly_1__480@NODE_1115_length_5039_cov_76_496380_g636_i1_p2_GENE_NODE_1115_length_5039_cov_76_496380_g636_i1NODE_1115_length_5039_cov_76_496380_g636_i1_p2_ORF_typecomplete_len637_score92_09Glycos_transf_1/PF00534_20/6_6e24Glyco_transf_4/PF13439_6/6_9e15Glyco_trans_1_4/PF13692_6/3_4e11Glyco_trans_4_4/PF13579_6/0_089BORG_CEP/PF14957_6/15_NODE_1115_length_5039_cov_76_496380_g636_i1411951